MTDNSNDNAEFDKALAKCLNFLIAYGCCERCCLVIFDKHLVTHPSIATDRKVNFIR